jgi:hypothetical protein
MKSPQINILPRINQVWMAVSVDDDGSEGVCAIRTDNGWLPLVAADEKRLEFIIEQARFLAEAQRRIIRVVKMCSREEVAVIDGRN